MNRSIFQFSNRLLYRGLRPASSWRYPMSVESPVHVVIRGFATFDDKETKSLRDTVNRIQGNEKEETSNASTKIDSDYIFRKVVGISERLLSEVNLAFADLVKSGQAKDINKKIRPVATEEGEKEYSGPVEIMVIDESERLTAWERMQRRLTDAPIIQGILSKAGDIYEKSGAKKVKEKADDLAEDAKEAWETSQNPWVYRMSSVYDTLTRESEYTVAIRELRKLDPEFEFEAWRKDVVEQTLPQIMSWILEGKINQLKPWLGEGVFKRIAAEITARNQEGVEIDTRILAIMNSEILAVELDTVEKGSPIIVLHFMCQQINCVKKKDDGTIVEGAEDDIKANSYVVAFQRELNEEKGELNWKIIDFRFNGAIAYL